MTWAITQSIDERVNMQTSVGEKLIVVKLACTVDSSSSGTVEVLPDDPEHRVIHGTWLYLIKLEFVDADVNFDFDVVDKEGDAIVNTSGNAFGATTFIPGATTCGVYPPITNYCGVVMDATGAITNGKKFNAYLYFLK